MAMRDLRLAIACLAIVVIFFVAIFFHLTDDEGGGITEICEYPQVITQGAGTTSTVYPLDPC